MPIRTYWAGDSRYYHDTVPSWSSSIQRQIAAHDVVIPAKAHVERVVCDLAIACKQFARAPLYVIGDMMLWQLNIDRVKFPSDEYPSGYLRSIQSQSGPMACSSNSVWEGGLQNWVEGAGSVPGPGGWRQDVTLVSLIHWSGGMDVMSQPRSDGTLGLDEGTTTYGYTLDLIGGGTEGGLWDLDAPVFTATVTMKVLYKLSTVL